LGVNGPPVEGRARLLKPLVVLKREVAGLNVMETNGVVDVDAVLAGGEGMGDVMVSQLKTLDDLFCFQ
jgi:hypothetical protein